MPAVTDPDYGPRDECKQIDDKNNEGTQILKQSTVRVFNYIQMFTMHP